MNTMTPSIRPSRPPVPTLIALGLLAVVPLRLAWGMVAALLDGEWAGLILVPVIAVSVIVLLGLWRGKRGAYLVTVVIALLQVMATIGDAFPDDPNAPGDAASQLADNWTALVWAVPPLVLLLLLVASRQTRAFYNRY